MRGGEERRFTTSGEIAARLGVPRATASQVLDRGQALLQPEFAATETLFRSGLLDASKTSLVVRRLQDADTEVAVAVQERVLPWAPRRTASQLSRDIDRELAALDPGGVSSRRKRNVGRRHVTRPREAGEGVHEMRLLLPSLDAFLLDATLDAIAAGARAAGDKRALSQLRADAITGMTLRTLQGSQHVACRNATDADDTDDAAPGVAPAIPGTGLRTIAGGPSVSAVADGNGTDAAGAAANGRADLLPDGVPLAGLLEALSGLVEPARPWWTPAGISPVFPPPGISVNVDVTVPLDALLPDDRDSGDNGRGMPARRGRGMPARRGRTEPATGGRRPPGGDRGSTGSASAAGAADAVAEVTIGTRRVPVPAITARALAAGGVRRRLATDPLSGVVLDGTITLLPRRIGPRQLAAPAQQVPQHLANAIDDAVVGRLQHGLDLSAGSSCSDRPGRLPQIAGRGPLPGQPVGAYETTPYPQALHETGPDPTTRRNPTLLGAYRGPLALSAQLQEHRDVSGTWEDELHDAVGQGPVGERGRRDGVGGRRRVVGVERIRGQYARTAHRRRGAAQIQPDRAGRFGVEVGCGDECRVASTRGGD